MRFEWVEEKRQANMHKHGLDFADAPAVFAGATFTFEDDRFDYGEERFTTLGMLAGGVITCALSPCERLPNMNRDSTSGVSQTDWDYVAALQDEDIDLSDIPEVTAEQMAKARLRIGGRPVPISEGSLVVVLEPEIAQVFQTPETVKAILRAIASTMPPVRERGVLSQEKVAAG